MTRTTSSRLAALAAVALLAGSLAGCRSEDPRVRHLASGISRDSAVVAMGGAEPERPYTYLVGGQYVEAMLYRRGDPEGPMEDLVRDQITPIVLVDGKVSGWGWKHWDSVAAAHNIEVTHKPQ